MLVKTWKLVSATTDSLTLLIRPTYTLRRLWTLERNQSFIGQSNSLFSFLLFKIKGRPEQKGWNIDKIWPNPINERNSYTEHAYTYLYTFIHTVTYQKYYKKKILQIAIPSKNSNFRFSPWQVLQQIANPLHMTVIILSFCLLHCSSSIFFHLPGYLPQSQTPVRILHHTGIPDWARIPHRADYFKGRLSCPASPLPPQHSILPPPSLPLPTHESRDTLEGELRVSCICTSWTFGHNSNFCY